MNSKRKPNKIGALTQAKFIKMLMTPQFTTTEIAVETGMHRTTAYRYMRALHSEGVVYVHHFEPDRLGRYNGAVYVIGEGADAKKYAGNTRAAHDARQRVRRLAAAKALRAQAKLTNALKPPAGYTAEELERDNPHNAWMREGA